MNATAGRSNAFPRHVNSVRNWASAGRPRAKPESKIDCLFWMAISPAGDYRAVSGIGGLGYELRKLSSRGDFSYRLAIYRSPHPSPKNHPPPQNAPPTKAQPVHHPPPTSPLLQHSPTTDIHSPRRPAHTRTMLGRLLSRRRRLACETRHRPNRATNAGQEATRPRGSSQGGSLSVDSDCLFRAARLHSHRTLGRQVLAAFRANAPQ